MRHALAAAAGLLLASAAPADIPLPDNLRYVDPRVAFEGLEKYPGHVFHLSFLTFTGGPGGVPHSRIEVKDSRPSPLMAQRRILDFQLLALERKAYDSKAKADQSLAWLADKTEGVLSAAVPAPSTVAKVGVEPPVTAYRVAIADGKLTAEPVPGVKPGAAPPDGKRGDATPPGQTSWVAGIGLAVGLVWVGLWWVRRG